MHCVTQLMGQCTDILILIIIVHQDIRMDIVYAAVGVGACIFAGIWVNIYPSAFETLFGYFDIIFSQRLQRIKDKLAGLFIRIFQINTFDHRCVKVGIFQLIHTKHSFFQFQVSLKCVKVIMNILN